MDYLPVVVQKWVEGKIDPQSQHLIERWSQVYFVLLSVTCFLASWLSGSVLLALEVFVGGFLVLLLATVPPWPYFNRFRIRYLPVRKLHNS